MINLKLNKLQQINAIAIFDAITNGPKTIAQLSEITNTSPNTVELLCSYLEEKGFICSSIIKTGNIGRPTTLYSLYSDNFAVYIEESKTRFNCIFINANGVAIERLDKYKNPKISLDVIFSRFERDIKEFDNDRNLTRNIIISCYAETIPFLPEGFKRINREEFIADSIKKDDEHSLFVFDGKCILSLNGKISTSNARKNELQAIIPFDRTFIFEEPYYDALFPAISSSIIKEMRKQI